ncbi:hypothetical protein PV08_05464 [Exophiala spinifera]|uniref:RNA-dependent RNA polymerase n=1 Tax=Exophiala spinifera TaxID=91928 RepID=A0A0D2B938_9EURO|nr:uncharacterized protein PV08_05464 [Exophiala spinifera]KIW15418.1 hypothetical protein PV08_05464 [Exophiala spinifera]
MRPHQQHYVPSRAEPMQPDTRHAPNEDWRSAPSVKCRLRRLPKGTTTLQIHKNLRRYGNVEFIRIDETRQGESSRSALITFKPPPDRAPWKSGLAKIPFVLDPQGVGPCPTVEVVGPLETQGTTYVQSPIRSGVKYPSEITLQAESIDFGYLEHPTSMVVKATRQSSDSGSVKLLLNLTKLEMQVHFPINLRSTKGSSTVRAYRFFVALDDQFSLCQVPSSASTSLILHLAHPPWYSRQSKEAVALSHSEGSLRWAQDDTWFRQTDIVDDKEAYAIIDRSPVSAKKLHNSINIAKWTTFRVSVKSMPGQPELSTPLQQFLNALQDFNVPIRHDPNIKVSHDLNYMAPIWDLLDSSNMALSLVEELAAIYLPFDVRYQLEVCMSHGWLNEYTLDEDFLRRLAALPPHRAKQTLIHVDTHQQRVYNPMDIFTDFRYSKPVRARPLPPNCVELHHATVTATGILFHTPSIEVTNRIVRKYIRESNRFLRIRFEDDIYRGQSRLYPATTGKMTLIHEKVRRTLTHGIVLGDRHYHFLAWGNSQLREHGAYFFASTNGITADTIRSDMGVFEREKVVAKRAARMGQCFSTTRAVSVVINRKWKKHPLPDICNEGHNFTDGIGKISPLTAQLVHSTLKLKGPVPSAFQFRMGGCKGVLAVDPSLPDVDIKIRPSQYKFDSTSDELEIIRVSEFWQPYLNRQLILVLSHLGVPDAVFLNKQEECIRTLDQALTDDESALRALRDTVDPNLMTLSIASMVESGFRHSNDPFVTSLLRLYRAWTLKYLKEKAKIPVKQGAFVLGVVDETGSLKGYTDSEEQRYSQDRTHSNLPEIFIQYTDQHTRTPRIVEGVCIIARNPSLHRGDIRVVRAVDEKKLHHLTDVLVMPSTGDRDLPSMCSGGDLDGDDYVVIWDPDLIPTEWNAKPFDYDAPKPLEKDEISTKDIIGFFCEYMKNDYLGRIAHAHLAAADYLDEGVRSEQCLELVKLHSMAVDYPKTGVPAVMQRGLERTKFPHFMEKKRSGEYHSHKILGQLYDAVERVKFEPNWDGIFDQRILRHSSPPQEIMDLVRQLKKDYDESMRRIMAQHQICTEFEVWSTFVMHHSKAARDFKFHEEIGEHSKNLKQQYYDAFVTEARGTEFEKLVPFAVAAYRLARDQLQDYLLRREIFEGDGEPVASPGEVPFISFPWVLQDVLGKIARSTACEVFMPEPNQNHSLSEHGQQLEAILDKFDKADGYIDWLEIGEHLPDPLVPTVSAKVEVLESNQAEIQQLGATSTQRSDNEMSSFPGNGPPSSTLRAPGELTLCTSDSKLQRTSTPDKGSVDSPMPSSTFSSIESAETSPDDVKPVSSILSPEGLSDNPGGLGPDRSSTQHVLAHAANNKQVFTDPTLMSRDELNALGMIDDEDEDFTF